MDDYEQIIGEECSGSQVIKSNYTNHEHTNEIDSFLISSEQVTHNNNFNIFPPQNVKQVSVTSENLLQGHKIQPHIFCLFCKEALVDKCFMCIICDNLRLCSSCRNKHRSSHPLILIRNISSSSINSLNDLFFYYNGQRYQLSSG